MSKPGSISMSAEGEDRVGGQTEDVVHTMLLAPVHGLSPAIMSVATNGDACVRPVQSDTPHQPAQMGAHLLAIWCLPRAQDGQHAMAGVGVIDMNRQEAPFVIMGIEQRQLLMAVHGVCGIVDIECDPLWRSPVTLAPQVHHGARQSDQAAQVWGVLPT